MFCGPYFLMNTMQAGTHASRDHFHLFNVFGMTEPSTSRESNRRNLLVSAGSHPSSPFTIGRLLRTFSSPSGVPHPGFTLSTPYHRLLQLAGATEQKEDIQLTTKGYDHLFKVRKIFDLTDPLYREVYCPGRELSIDESMIHFKGRLYFRHFCLLNRSDRGLIRPLLSFYR